MEYQRDRIIYAPLAGDAEHMYEDDTARDLYWLITLLANRQKEKLDYGLITIKNNVFNIVFIKILLAVGFEILFGTESSSTD